MIPYIVKIIKNQQSITLSADGNIDYDNYLWSALYKLVKVLKEGFVSKEELSIKLSNDHSFFSLYEENSYSNLVIDLDHNLMDMPIIPIYEFNEVNPAECCIAIKNINDKFYAVYEDGSEYQMANVNFDDVSLLRKKQVTIDEFLKVSSFIASIIKTPDDSDFILNNELVMRFNNI